jgi:hypothetical protein
MKYLKHYVDGLNSWNSIFGDAPMEFPLSAADVEAINNRIDSSLSPEHLHCDGEISPASAKEKYHYLIAVHADLMVYAAENQLKIPELN